MELTSGTKLNKSHIQSCLYVEDACILGNSTCCEQQLLEQRKYFFKEDDLQKFKHFHQIRESKREKVVFHEMPGVAPHIQYI